MTKIIKRIEESFIDYPDNKSIALCVIIPGCVNNCAGCQNPWFQSPNPAPETVDELSIDELDKKLDKLCKLNNTNKIVLSGGDPLSPYNIEYTKSFLEKYKEKYDICIYTGHNIDYVKENNVIGFKFIKCGKFDINNKRESDKTDEKMIFASPNQELYDDKLNLISKDGIYYFN